jgi:hypothetical protein
MDRGYQIVEPEGLALLLGVPADFPVCVALLRWLIEEIELELGPALTGIELEVIRVDYQGAYPALGVHYREAVEDVAPMLEGAIERLLRDRPVAHFVDFLVRNPTDWAGISARLLTRQP